MSRQENRVRLKEAGANSTRSNLIFRLELSSVFFMSIKKAKETLAEREHNNGVLKLWRHDLEELGKRHDKAYEEIESLCCGLNTVTVEEYDKVSEELTALMSQVRRINQLFFYGSPSKVKNWMEDFSKEVNSLEKLLDQHRETFRKLKES